MALVGTYLVSDNTFKIGSKGKNSTLPADMVTIAEMSSFSVSIDSGTEDWNSMTTGGWANSMVVSKGVTISFAGKRCVGDAGNDYVAKCAFATGQDAETKFEWNMPDGTKISGDVIVSVTNLGGGDSTSVAALEFDLKFKGKPTITVAE